MREFAWRLIAFIVSRRPVARALIQRSRRTPYVHLDGYMKRWWVFNGYSNEMGLDDAQREQAKALSWLPSIRVHHILRADDNDHPHDHPWEARTIILDGWYLEHRVGAPSRMMRRGDTAPIRHESYHHIHEVSPAGVYTLFITWSYAGSWGFLVDGVKVPWREYLARYRGAARSQRPHRRVS